jgi:hypothetical protein
MLLSQLNRKAVISFFTFVIAIVKDIFVSWLEIIPERGLTNSLVSYFFIIPILIIGLIFSIQVIRENYKHKTYENRHFFDVNLFLSLPALLCFLYGFIMMIVFIW